MNVTMTLHGEDICYVWVVFYQDIDKKIWLYGMHWQAYQQLFSTTQSQSGMQTMYNVLRENAIQTFCIDLNFFFCYNAS